MQEWLEKSKLQIWPSSHSQMRQKVIAVLGLHPYQCTHDGQVNSFLFLGLEDSRCTKEIRAKLCKRSGCQFVSEKKTAEKSQH